MKVDALHRVGPAWPWQEGAAAEVKRMTDGRPEWATGGPRPELERYRADFTRGEGPRDRWGVIIKQRTYRAWRGRNRGRGRGRGGGRGSGRGRGGGQSGGGGAPPCGGGGFDEGGDGNGGEGGAGGGADAQPPVDDGDGGAGIQPPAAPEDDAGGEDGPAPEADAGEGDGAASAAAESNGNGAAPEGPPPGDETMAEVPEEVEESPPPVVSAEKVVSAEASALAARISALCTQVQWAAGLSSEADYDIAADLLAAAKAAKTGGSA